jgi:hypothetical protein
LLITAPTSRGAYGDIWNRKCLPGVIRKLDRGIHVCMANRKSHQMHGPSIVQGQDTKHLMSARAPNNPLRQPAVCPFS